MELPKAETFCIYETVPVVVVRQNQDLILTIFWLLAPKFKPFNNC